MRRLFLVAVSLTLLTAPAWGQGTPSAGPEARRLEEQARAKLRDRERLREEADAAAREVERLRRRLVDLARLQTAGEQVVVEQRERLEVANQREGALIARLGANRARLTRLLSALQLYSKDPPPALLVSSESATDAVRAAILMRAVTPELNRQARALQAEADAIALVRREAAMAGEALFTAESEVADRKAEIERLIVEKSALELRLNAEAEVADREARALAARVRDLGGLVRGLEELDARAAAHVRPAGRVSLTAPVSGPLVRRFGERDQAGRSDGVAFQVASGGLVAAPADGDVEYAGPLDGWGQVVILHLGGGWRVVLAGLGEVSTGAGRTVAAGEPVGRAARRGDADAEVYMELRREGAPVDPLPRLDASRSD